MVPFVDEGASRGRQAAREGTAGRCQAEHAACGGRSVEQDQARALDRSRQRRGC